MNAKQNVNNLCRTCLTQLNDLFSVFDYVQIKDTSNVLISHILMECASIEIISDDLLPKNICTDCLSMAKQSYLFKQTCQDAQKYLTDIIEKDDSEFQVPLHSELIIKKDLLDDIINDNSYDHEETISGIEYLETESDHMYDSNEQTNSLESENFRGFDKNETFEKLIDHGGFLNNIFDYGEPSEIKSEVKSEISTFMNDPCDNTEKFEKVKSIVDKKKHGSRQKKNGYCSFCDTIYSNQYFNDHIKTCKKKPATFTTAESLMCPICQKQTSRRSALLAHRITYHSENMPNGAAVEKYIGEPKMDSDDPNIKNRYCNFCDRLIPYKYFTAHEDTCEKKPEKCTKDDYTRCPLCRQVFRSRRYLTHHRMVVHGDNLPENYNKRVFVCKTCDRKFLWHIQYSRHLRICNNENLFKVVKFENMEEESETVATSTLYCKLCKIEFQNWEEFENHIATHENKNVYVCNICGKMFGSHKSLSLHMRLEKRKMFLSATRQRKSYCCFCDTVLTFQYFIDHIKTCEKKPETYTKEDCLVCPVCKKLTSSRRELLAHRVTFHPKNVPKYDDVEKETHSQQVQPNNIIKSNSYCNFCDHLIETKFFLNHLKKCEKRPEKCTEEDYLRCPICKQSVPKRRYITSHRFTVHADNLPVNYNENMLACKNCDQRFLTYTRFNRHMMICNPNSDSFKVVTFGELYTESEQDTVDVYKMYCKLCKIRFVDEEEFNQHVKSDENKKVFVCKVCGNIFQKYGALMHHLRLHRDRKKFLCTICGKEFKALKNVELHMRIHTGEKPFACDKCDKRFCQNAMLKSHMITHSDKRGYKCHICEVTFKRRGKWTAHMRDHKEKTEGKQYSCEICSRTFLSSVKLKVHMEIHKRRSRINLCTTCDRTFSSSHALKVHTRLHTGERPYVCPICNEGFPQGISLKLHMKHHK